MSKRKTFADRMAETQALKGRRDLSKAKVSRAQREAVAPRAPAAAQLAYSSVFDTYTKKVERLVERHVVSKLPVLGSGEGLDHAALERGLQELKAALDAAAPALRRSMAAAATRTAAHAHREVQRMMGMSIPVGDEMKFLVQFFVDRQIDLVRKMNTRQVLVLRRRIQAYREGDSMRETILSGLWVTRHGGPVIARTECHQFMLKEVSRWCAAVGSQGWIYHTCRDDLVRPSHRALDGKFFGWHEHPPQLDEPNCRCQKVPAEAVLP